MSKADRSVGDPEKRDDLAARLRVAEERYRALVESLPAVIYIEDARYDGPTEYIGPQIEEILGLSQAEYLAHPSFWESHLDPEDRKWVVDEYRTWLAGAEPGDAGALQPYRLVADDGRVTWMDDRFTLLEDESGHRYVQGVMFDVTARLTAQRNLDSRDRVLDAVAVIAQKLLTAQDWEEVIDEVLQRLGEATDIRRVSVWQNVPQPDGSVRSRFAFGWSAPDVEPSDPMGTEMDLDGSWANWARAMQERVAVTGFTRDRPPGEREWFRERDMTSILDVPVFVDGHWWGAIGLDTSEERVWSDPEIEALEVAAETLGAAISRRSTAEHLQETEGRYKALVEQIPAVLYIDHPGVEDLTSYISPQVEEILGLSAKAWRDDAGLWYRHLHPDDQNYALLTYRRGVASGRPFSYEYRMLTPRGLVWIRDDAIVLQDPDGRVSVQGVMFDVTEEKLAEEALLASESREREAAERLRAVDQMKNAFLAAVSHELRSPLTSVLGLAVTLETMDLPEAERSDLLNRLTANAKKLERLLADLLDIDRLSRGVVTADRRTTDVGELIQRTSEAADYLGTRTLKVEAERVVATVDGPKVERILENLLANTARHTPQGTTVWVRVQPYREGVLICVEDDGPGVSEELRDSIFDPFRQGPTTRPHSPGTGIGLTLVKNFVDLHDGAVWVTDRAGGGASFRVYLPDVRADDPN